jgi:hypothetical protein
VAEVLSQQMLKVIDQYMIGLDTPLSHRVNSMVKEGRWLDIANLKVNPSDYVDADSYFKDACASEFLRKFKGLPTGVDLHKVALDAFFECEKTCSRTNSRIARYVDWFECGFFGDATDEKLFVFIQRIRRIVGDVLGCLPQTLDLKFGPGSTYYDRGDKITIPHKMSSRLTRTSLAWWTDSFLFETAWGRAVLKHRPRHSQPSEIRGNRFTSVPKDSSKNRGICIEPGQNLAFQLAIGKVLKRRLKLAGIDLKSGQSRHRALARSASVTGHLATIDLSNASDTVARQLVKLFLPKGWYDLLKDLRSPLTRVGGRWYHLSKFSSMGNGFTFELETLIFFAMARAVAEVNSLTDGDISVYGDDIILPTPLARDYVALLKLFGFSPNERKTFIEGPFRESCGGDFFNGQEVRPFYLKEHPYEPQHWIKLANGLRRLGVTDTVCNTWRFGLLRPWLHALDAIPVAIRRCRGPRAFGDQVIHDVPLKWYVRSHPAGQSWVRTYEPIARRVPLSRFQVEVQLASLLYGVPSSGAGIRDGISGHRRKWKPLIEAVEF